MLTNTLIIGLLLFSFSHEPRLQEQLDILERLKGDSPIFVDTKIGTVPLKQVVAPKRADDLWHQEGDYSQAVKKAEQERKMLLVYFCDTEGTCDSACERFKAETLDDPLVRSKLQDYVCLQLPLDASIVVDGKKTVLLEHDSFKEMHGRPGIAIVDFQHDDPKLYGMVASVFPLTDQLWYTPEKLAVILDLPAGTLTQRTLIFAVRTHPDKPESTEGKASAYLFKEAADQSQYQADIRLQGHHNWASRFARISARLHAAAPREVCAESWPNENLVEAAVDCVHCWRLSQGHWSAVRAHHAFYGYDMKLGRNGIWYATGIFAR
ncbi:MAG: hypothetical protein ACWGMZ_06685 [Thermoguttaceae bacterium]